MSADELNTSTGSSVDLADGLLDAAEASASQDRVTYLLADRVAFYKAARRTR